MSEEFYLGHLDRQPEDAAARLLLAEFLAERGDPLAEGYDWMARHNVKPQDYRSTRTWDWNDKSHFDNLVGTIPSYFFEELQNGKLSVAESYREYPTRRAAELALCAAIQRCKRSTRFAIASGSERPAQ